MGAAFKLGSRNTLLKFCGVVAIGCIAIDNTWWSYRAGWPHQANQLKMVEYLQSHPVSGRLGGWNVGVPGYFLDGRIVNLDGLMNDQIYPFIRDGTVLDYISQSKIKYLIDYRYMIYEQGAERCGYSVVSIAKRIRPLHVVAAPNPKNFLGDYMLYEWSDGQSAPRTTREGQQGQ